MADDVVEVKGPDGRIHYFDPGTPWGNIDGEMRRRYQGWKPPQTGSQAGAPTAVTGPLPYQGMRETKPYLSDEDWNQIMLSTALGEKNRGIIQAIQNTPGHIGRVEREKVIQKRLGEREEKQFSAQKQMEMLDQIVDNAKRLTPEEYANALGPRNTAKLPKEQPLMIGSNAIGHLAIPFMQQPTTVDPKTGIPINEELTPVHRDAIIHPDDPKAQHHWDVQNTMEHDIDALVANFIATAGQAAGSDERVRQLREAVARVRGAHDQKAFEDLSHHVRYLLAQNGGMSIPQAMAVPSSPPAGAIQMLMSDTSKAARDEFDEKYGEGMASRIINASNRSKAPQ